MWAIRRFCINAHIVYISSSITSICQRSNFRPTSRKSPKGPHKYTVLHQEGLTHVGTCSSRGPKSYAVAGHVLEDLSACLFVPIPVSPCDQWNPNFVLLALFNQSGPPCLASTQIRLPVGLRGGAPIDLVCHTDAIYIRVVTGIVLVRTIQMIARESY